MEGGDMGAQQGQPPDSLGEQESTTPRTCTVLLPNSRTLSEPRTELSLRDISSTAGLSVNRFPGFSSDVSTSDIQPSQTLRSD